MTDTAVEGVRLPPAELVFMNKSADEGLNQGREQVRRLKAMGLGLDEGLLLDIGCGYGRFAYGLLASGFAGRYVGLDITPDRVSWLQENFTPAQPRYRFVHVDVKNELYNPKGRSAPVGYATALGGELADTVVLLSVFTHMYEDDIRAHLKNIRAVMGAQSVLCFTCFLFDGPAIQGIAEGRARRNFEHRLSDHCRYDRKGHPLQAIAYSEPFVTELVREAGLVPDIRRGGWSGMPVGDDALNQDVVFCRPG